MSTAAASTAARAISGPRLRIVSLLTLLKPPRFASVSDRDGSHHPRAARAARRDLAALSRGLDLDRVRRLLAFSPSAVRAAKVQNRALSASRFLSRSWVNNYLCALTLMGALALLGRWRLLGACLAPWAVLMVWPEVHATRPAWGHRLGAWVMRKAREYFHLTVVLEDEKAFA